MRILLFGKNGQVGWELQRSLAPLGAVVALDRQGEQGLCGDLANLDGIVATLAQVKPDIIVNAAAYTAVDKAEQARQQASQINASAPQQMAEYARRAGALLVHYSTDYVFDGSGMQPWQEADPAGPLNHYGASKLAGEQAIQASACQHLIFRTSWVYAARGSNFMNTMLNLGRTRDALSIVSDQTGAPTPARLIAEVSALALHRGLSSGLYHLTSAGATSWHGFAREIFARAITLGETLQIDLAQVKAIASSEYPTPAARPLNSRLALDKLQSALGIQLPTWQDQLTLTLQDHLKG